MNSLWMNSSDNISRTMGAKRVDGAESLNMGYGKGIPPSTTADAGKILMVDANGKPAWVAPSSVL